MLSYKDFNSWDQGESILITGGAGFISDHLAG
jgi:nucleoside-diphosphate-sugar epimerase